MNPDTILSVLTRQQWVETIPLDHAGVIELTVYGQTPGDAADLANAIANSYCDYRNQGRTVAQVLNPAVPDPKALPHKSPEVVFRALFGSLLGLVVGLVVARIVAARKRGMPQEG